MSLKSLHREFIEKANRQMTLGGKLPINAKEPVHVIIATERWGMLDDKLVKTYNFLNQDDKVDFIVALMKYESSVGHHAALVMNRDKIVIQLQTKDLGKVTEIDKEYAKFADSLFKDILYNSNNEY